VKALATELGLPVTYDPADVTEVGAALGVVVAFGRIIKPDVLARLEMINIHFSLLPRWRGAAPVERAILAGDTETGVCIMAVEEGLDTGGVYRRRVVPIHEDETAEHLTARLATVGAELLVSALSEGLGEAQPQSGEVTYAAKIAPEDLRLDWTMSAAELQRVVRVGKAWTSWRGRRLIVLAATVCSPDGPTGAFGDDPGRLVDDTVVTGAGRLRLLQVQPEGRQAVGMQDWLRGARPGPGDRLGK
jgi:methionyl-tRNA formyltransferase